MNKQNTVTVVLMRENDERNLFGEEPFTSTILGAYTGPEPANSDINTILHKRFQAIGRYYEEKIRGLESEIDRLVGEYAQAQDSELRQSISRDIDYCKNDIETYRGRKVPHTAVKNAPDGTLLSITVSDSHLDWKCTFELHPVNITGDLERPIMDGVGIIAEERRRQIMEEGYNIQYDYWHQNDELALAAATYSLPKRHRRNHNPDGEGLRPTHWPFPPCSWKPTPDDRIRELAKAGALNAAEIDRLLRMKKK